jgi:ABC-type antimicrobial peptide transport system permease subunit
VDPVGHHLANSRDGLMREIVGVVGDVRFDGPTRNLQEELFLPYRQEPWPAMTIVVASALPADQIAALLRREVARLDRDQPVTDVTRMEGIVSASTVQQQFTSGLLGLFALLATTLATIGLYGVIALFVSQRRHEFGIRMALGARQVDVLLLVMKQGLQVILAGAAIGLIIAFAARHVLSGLLFGVTATNVVSYLGATVVLCAIGLIACYIPARRAVATDPARALRSE